MGKLPLLLGGALLLSGCATPPEENTPEAPASYADYSFAQSLLDGEGDLEDALFTIAWSSGLPIEAPDDHWLFLVSEELGAAVLQLNDGSAPLAMTPGEGFYWLEVPLDEPAGLTYSFVTESLEQLPDPWARSYDYADTAMVSYVRPPTEVPHLERWPLATDGLLAPRTLRALVPAGEGPWPLLIAADGNNLFDPLAMWGGWRLQEAVSALDTPMLVVGVDNTADRIWEYTHTTDTIDGQLYGGGGDEYAAFIQELVRPHLEASYPTAGPVGLLGSSLGGLIALHINQLYPSDYAFVASLSGTLGWGRYGKKHKIMQQLYLAYPADATVLYVDSGGSDGDGSCDDPDGDGYVEDDPNSTDNYCVNRHFADAMAAHGYEWNTTLHHWWEPDAPHNENAWAQRVHRPLALFADLAN
jgi:predicted alpha/beta superfamily hydrolase